MRARNHSSRFIEMFGNAETTKPLSYCIGTTFPGEWGEDDSDGNGVNVIRTTNFTNSGKLDLTNVVTRKIDQAKIDKKHLIPGDIILERSGGTADNPVGRVVYFEAIGTFLFNNFTQLLRCKEGVNSLFVFYSLYNYYHTHKSEIRSMGNKTTGIQNLKMDKYWDIPIAEVPPVQQEQFVSLYKQADKSKFNGFKSRFIEELYSRYPKQKLGEHISVIRGVSYKPSDVRSNNSETSTAMILRSNNITDGEINFDDLVFVVKERVQKEQELHAGDIVMCGSNGSISLVGKAGLLKTNRPNISFGAFCLGIKCKETVLPEYLNTYFNTPVYREEIESMGNGTNIINIRPNNITNLMIPIPPSDEQKSFVNIVQQADKSKFELKQAIEKIDKVIRALMQ